MRNLCKSAVLVFASLLIATRPAWSYFSDRALSETVFNVTDSVSIQLIEDRWSPEDQDDKGVPKAARGLVAEQRIEKNPCVKNESPIDVWAALFIRVPKEAISLVDKNTQAIFVPQSKTALFSFSVKDGAWLEIPELSCDQDTYVTYAYIFEEPLLPEQCSPELFDSVTVCNFLAGATEGVKDIQVEARAVQAEGVPDVDAAKAFFIANSSGESWG